MTDRFSDESFRNRDIQFDYPAVGVGTEAMRNILCGRFRIHFRRSGSAPAIASACLERAFEEAGRRTPIEKNQEDRTTGIVALVEHRSEAAQRLRTFEEDRRFQSGGEPLLAQVR